MSLKPETVNRWRQFTGRMVMAQAKEPQRADRLKAALRENLKRRKAQARDRGAGVSEKVATDKRDSSEE